MISIINHIDGVIKITLKINEMPSEYNIFLVSCGAIKKFMTRSMTYFVRPLHFENDELW